MVELGPVKELITGVARLWSIGHNVRLHDVRLDRAERDHWAWCGERDRNLRKELRHIDNDMREQGLFDSGIRMGARSRAKAAALRELEDRRRALADLHQDVRLQETILERTYRQARRQPIRQAGPSDAEQKLESQWREPERDRIGPVELPVDLDRIDLAGDPPSSE